TLYKPGDDVFGMLPFPRGHGAYAEYAVGPTRAFVLKPDRLDHVQAAAIPMVGLTAWQALVDTARVGEGSRVLVNGAAGGIGHLGVQIAKARGARVAGLASAANAEFVRSLGADEAIDYDGADFGQAVRDQDVVLDVVGGDYPARALDVLRPGGILVSTQPSSLPPLAETAAGRGIRLAGLIVEADQVGMTALAELAATGKLVPTIAATFPLQEARAASATADLAATDGRFPLEEGGAAESGKHGPGKVVLTMPRGTGPNPSTAPQPLLGITQLEGSRSAMSFTITIRQLARGSAAVAVAGAVVGAAAVVAWAGGSSAAGHSVGQPPPEWAANAGGWPAHNYDLSNTRATTRTSISSRTVSGLTVSWRFA